jgi:hypothetical protein
MRSASRCGPTGLILLITAATVGALFGASYCLGRTADPEVTFLDPQRAPTIDEAVVAQAMSYAIASHENNDVIFLGDSTSRMGIKPEAFTEVCGMSAWNLGSMRRIGPYGFMITVATYLQNHPAPKAVVLCVTPTIFENDPSSLDGEIQQRLVWVYGPEIGTAWENVPFIARRGAVRFWFPAIRNKPLMGLESETYFTLETKNLRSRGFFALHGDHGPGNGIPMYTPEMAVRPEWTDGCARIANLCDASGCKFLILFGPMPNGLKGARDWTLLDKWGRSFEAAHRCATVGTPIFYDDRIMWDALHVNRLGVEKFTALVAKDVQAALGK